MTEATPETVKVHILSDGFNWTNNQRVVKLALGRKMKISFLIMLGAEGNLSISVTSVKTHVTLEEETMIPGESYNMLPEKLYGTLVNLAIQIHNSIFAHKFNLETEDTAGLVR